MLERARNGSTIARLLRRSGQRAATALEGSRLAGALAGGWRRVAGAGGLEDAEGAGTSDGETKRGEAVGPRPRSRVRDAFRASILGGAVATFAAVGDRLATAANGARLVAVAVAVRCWTLGSAIYRWLTAEPDPEVIVIDLRETRTVGPFIAVVDRAVAFVVESAPASRLASIAAAIASVVFARPVQVASLFAIGATTAIVGLVAVTGALTRPLLVGCLALLALSALGLRSRRTLEEVRSSRPVELLAAAFEPPEPPAHPEPAMKADRNGRKRSEDDGGPTEDDIGDDGETAEGG